MTKIILLQITMTSKLTAKIGPSILNADLADLAGQSKLLMEQGRIPVI